MAERALEAAVAARVRESQRSQRRRFRQARMEGIATRKRQRAKETEMRNFRKRLRSRLREEMHLTMVELMRTDKATPFGRLL